MKNNIYYRTFKKEDAPALEKIICDTWHYEKFCTQKTAKALARLYLATCLANQTYTCVAVCDEEPVGVIMGKNENYFHSTPSHVLHQIMAVIFMLIRKEGRDILKMFDGYDTINKTLFAQSRETFDGEVAFFAVRSDQRGNGVGKELFHRLRAYMNSQGIRRFYLYTDSSCNYGFYEHQGMKKICEKKHSLTAFADKEMSFFLYGNVVAE